MNKGKAATGGALGSGALATALVFASGCLGTSVLLFLGISSGVLGGLSALEPYRPFLLVLGGVHEVLDAVFVEEFRLLGVVKQPKEMVSQLGLVVGPAEKDEHVVAHGGVVTFVIQDHQKSLDVF